MKSIILSFEIHTHFFSRDANVLRVWPLENSGMSLQTEVVFETKNDEQFSKPPHYNFDTVCFQPKLTCAFNGIRLNLILVLVAAFVT